MGIYSKQPFQKSTIHPNFSELGLEKRVSKKSPVSTAKDGEFHWVMRNCVEVRVERWCISLNNSSNKGWGFPDGSATCNAGDAGDVGSISELRRSPGVGNGNPFQYSCGENPMNR